MTNEARVELTWVEPIDTNGLITAYFVKTMSPVFTYIQQTSWYYPLATTHSLLPTFVPDPSYFLPYCLSVCLLT